VGVGCPHAAAPRRLGPHPQCYGRLLLTPGTAAALALQAAICLRALMSEAQWTALTAGTTAASMTMDRPDVINDVLKRAADQTSMRAASQLGAGFDSSVVGAVPKAAALGGIEQAMGLLATAEMQKKRMRAAVLLMWIHCMCVLTPMQMAAW